jgi:hypothetical protein
MFREGIDGFKGGLSAENYISISKTSRATATRTPLMYGAAIIRLVRGGPMASRR